MSSLARRAEIAGIEMLGLSPRFDDLNEDLRRVGVEQLGALVRHQLVTQDVVRFVDSAATEAA